MKTYGTAWQSPARNGMTDTRSTGGAPSAQAPKPRLNDRRSTR